MAGGFKTFGPTYNSTPYVRLGYEGTLNGAHEISATLVAAAKSDSSKEQLAGKIAAMGSDGVTTSNAGAAAIGLFREDLGDMINASLKASFYFRGGEYFIAESRLGTVGTTKQTIANFTVGDEVTTDANGGLIKYLADADGEGAGTDANGKAVGVVTYKGTYSAGNMYEWAGTAANGGNYLGIILYL